MVLLRNMSHYEYPSCKTPQGAAEFQKEKARLQERRRSQRRKTSITPATPPSRTTVVGEAARDRVQTPLAEKRNEENTRPQTTSTSTTNNNNNTRDLATRPKAKRTGDASPTRVSSTAAQNSSRGNHETARPQTRRRGSGKEKTVKGKGPKGARNLDVDRNWNENVSPPLKGREVDDDDVPMIIECWQ